MNLGQLDPVTFKQLSTRKSEWNDSGKLRVESKDKMCAEGRHSPDHGDAVLGCIVCGYRLSGAVTALAVGGSEVGASDFAAGHLGGW